MWPLPTSVAFSVTTLSWAHSQSLRAHICHVTSCTEPLPRLFIAPLHLQSKSYFFRKNSPTISPPSRASGHFLAFITQAILQLLVKLMDQYLSPPPLMYKLHENRDIVFGYSPLYS